MALPSSLGADGPACSAERGFGCLISRAGHRDSTHTSWPAATRTRSSMCRRAAATHAASIPCRSHQHTARSPILGGARLCACWRSAETSASPYAGPYLVVSKGAKTFTIQVSQRQEVISVDCLKAYTGLSLVSPAEATSCGRPPKKPAATSIQPTPSMKPQTGGAPVEDRTVAYLNTYSNMCLTIMAPVRPLVCVGMWKIHQLF
jgi:hypothetical protein